MHPLLEKLRSDEFFEEAILWSILPPRPAYNMLKAKCSFVHDIAKALKDGIMGDADIREFVKDVERTFKPGVKHEDDYALAALVAAFADEDTDLANEFIGDLARIQISELQTSRHVARECLREREERK